MPLTQKIGLTLALFTAGSLTAALPAAAQHVYDASADFSTTANASPLDGGVFSYGTEASLGGPFSLNTQMYTFTGNVSGAVQGWADPDNGFPYITKDVSNTNFVNINGNTSITVVPGQLDLHPGPSGEYSVLRFTAPTTSTYSFFSSFGGVDSNPTTTDVHVLLDGTALANGGINVNGGGNTASLASSSLALTKGDTLDFVVGYGNGTYFNDSTGLYATVTNSSSPVPEASTAVSLSLLAALGTGALTLARRRKMSAQAV